MIARSLAPLAAAALAGVVALSGCSGGKPPGPSSAAATPPSASAAPLRTSTPLPPEPTFQGTPAGAATDLKITSCPTDAGQQTAKATVTNSSQEKRDYAIYIIWLIKDNGAPQGAGLVTVKGLEPGQSKDIEVSASVANKSDLCVPNVKAGELA